jgi:hypothetical protein
VKDTRKLSYLLLGLALLVGLAGYFGPWVPHRAAGLVVTGIDLAEYVKFLPQYRSGQISLRREIFYLPLFAASVTAALLAGRRSLPIWARVLAAAVAVPLALAMLPPAWSPAILRDAEYRIQVIAICFCLALVPGILLTRRLPGRLVLAFIGLLCVAAAIVPVWGFLQIRPPIEELYRHPLPLGGGVFANITGYLAAAVVASAEIMRRGQAQS